MARVIVVAGFLGSGKTSLILGLGRRWTAAGLRVAVVENEVGTRGVDGPILERSGMVVREITAGCICCTLAGDLREATAAFLNDQRPDLICIEPTGVAGPQSVVDALQGLPGIDAIQVLAVVDALRAVRIDEFNPSYLAGLVEAAQVVALTKVDAAGDQRVGAAERLLAGLEARRPVLPTDSAAEADLDALARALDAAGTVGAVVGGSHGIDAVTAGRTFPWPVAATAAAHADGVLRHLAARVAAADGAVPGHLKAFIDAGGGGWCSLSLTHAVTGCQRRGGAIAGEGPVAITVSAIVAGFTASRLAALLDEALAPDLGLGGLRLRG